MTHETGNSAIFQAWRCIGCGRIEAPQPCLGVCQDRKVLLVDIDEHERVLREAEHLRHRIDALRLLLARLARARPRDDGWADSWEQLQVQARKALDADARMERADNHVALED